MSWTTWVAIAVVGADAIAAAPRWRALDDAQREARVVELQTEPFTQRVLDAAEGFIDVPYVESPLGEGEPPDTDPALRFDAVDCLTFIEQSMALAMSEHLSDVSKVLEKIRYHGEAHYPLRNHLMEAQWLPHNIAQGWLTDVTSQYGGEWMVESSKALTAASWRSPSSMALGLSVADQPLGTFPLRYVPLEKAAAVLEKVPSGTLVVIVREERSFKATRMTHLGLLVQKKRPYLRHASKSRHHRVVDERLDEFLERNGHYDKWRVVGVSLFEIGQPLPPAPIAVPLPPPPQPPPTPAL